MAKGGMSHTQFMQKYFPKEYAKRKAEGRCLHCGAKKTTPPLSLPSPRTDQTKALCPCASTHGWMWSEIKPKPKPAPSAAPAWRTRFGGECSSAESA